MTGRSLDEGSDISREEERISTLVEAIRERRRVRLAYRRKSDEVTSVHEVAPIDIRGGWTPRTEKTLYLWAWCFAEGQAEMHLITRIQRADLLESHFDPGALLRNWPTDKWPVPERWNVHRDWDITSLPDSK